LPGGIAAWHFSFIYQSGFCQFGFVIVDGGQGAA
jgi:hypothetical protein